MFRQIASLLGTSIGLLKAIVLVAESYVYAVKEGNATTTMPALAIVSRKGSMKN